MRILFVVLSPKPPERILAVDRQSQASAGMGIMLGLGRRMVGLNGRIVFRGVKRAFETDGFPAHNPFRQLRTESQRFAGPFDV